VRARDIWDRTNKTTWNFCVSERVSMPVSAKGLLVSHHSDLEASNEAGSHPVLARTSAVHAPALALFLLSVGSMNSRYSNQSRYEHMPYMCRMSGIVSHGDEP
jgi:hypothetical protein